MFTEQFKLIEQQISELVLFDEELKVIESKKGEKMLVQIGKSVFAPIKIEGDEKLLVDVGAGYFVNKKLAIQLDLGPAFISLTDSEYSESVSGIEYVVNFGMNYYFKTK